MKGPNFESHTYELATHIEGSGEVFGYMKETPIIQLITSIISMVFLSVIILVLGIIFMNVFCIKIAYHEAAKTYKMDIKVCKVDFVYLSR